MPLTRMHSDPGDIPNARTRESYKPARIRSGLIISEATPVLRQGYGYADAPGIYDDTKIAG